MPTKFALLAAALMLGSTLAGCGSNNTSEDPSGEPMGTAAFDDYSTIAGPAAERREKTITQHGETRSDPYHWLHDDNWQQVLRDPSVLSEDIRRHLEAENAYHDTLLEDTAGLREQLFEEMRARVREDDSTVPERHGDWAYYQRYREGGDYAVYARRPTGGGEEQILYDGDAEAGEHDYFSIETVTHSPDHHYIAYGIDTVGSEYYRLYVRDVQSGETRPEVIENTGGRVVWAADSNSFFYIERDDNQRPRRVRQHQLGGDPAEDRVVYEEQNHGLFLELDKTQSGAYILITSGDHTSSETYTLPADNAAAEPRLIAPRREGERYTVAHRGEHFYLLTNADSAVDFKVVRAPVDSPGRAHWEPWVAHQPGRLITELVAYQDFLVHLERRDARPRLVVSDYTGASDDAHSYEVPMQGEAYALELLPGLTFDTASIRYVYATPAQPEQTFDWHMAERERTLRKTQELPSGHDPERYVVERIDAPTDDGEQVPVTILRLKSTPLDGSAPLLLYGYGSYGYFVADEFSSPDLSLVDRGVIRAVAKVRGGSARGQQWYLDGKLDKKPNSFTDFVASAQALIDRGYTDAGQIVIDGRSAGGLLVGATVNLAPELLAGVVTEVPFVDVLNTMSDPSLPLTPPEWPEWGNPIESEADYQVIASYAPYENLRSDRPYPPVLATAGLTDSRVTYWEPAKWVARLRAEANGGPFVLHTNMGAGHAGSTARFESLREQAHLHSFALKVLGRAQTEPTGHE